LCYLIVCRSDKIYAFLLFAHPTTKVRTTTGKMPIPQGDV